MTGNPQEQRHLHRNHEQEADDVRGELNRGDGAGDGQRDQKDQEGNRKGEQDGERAEIVQDGYGPEYEVDQLSERRARAARFVEHVQKHAAEQGQEQLRRQVLRPIVKGRGPRGHGQRGEGVAGQEERRPVAPVRQEHRSRYQDGVVTEQRDLGVGPAGEQERRHESAADRHQRQSLRPEPIGEPGAAGRDPTHHHERRRPVDDVVEVERRVRRHVEHGNPAARDQLSVQAVSGRDESKAAVHQYESDDRALHDSGGLADPVVVDRQLFEVADADDDRDHADVEEPARSDARLERLAGRFRLDVNRGVIWRSAHSRADSGGERLWPRVRPRHGCCCGRLRCRHRRDRQNG
jgi:hypothetical protein